MMALQRFTSDTMITFRDYKNKSRFEGSDVWFAITDWPISREMYDKLVKHKAKSDTKVVLKIDENKC